jgi:hypothetical protein
MATRLLNFDLTHQAGMIAYVNGFLLLGIMSVAILPLVFLLRLPGAAPSRHPAPVME